VDISGDPWRAGQALMEFGQRICSARPRCAECPVSDGCPGPHAGNGPAAAPRRQPPFEGSVRQHRGRLLRRVLAEGAVALAPNDREVAAGLVGDGLAVLREGRLCAPTAAKLS
jgi:adenine-specific DNA glycosylase